MEIMRSAVSRVIVVALAAFALGIAAAAEAGPLSGQVRDQNGVPIVGATVEILDPNTFETLGIDTSDANGDYSIAIADGTYAAFLTPPPSSEISPVFLENIVVSGATTFDFVLQSANATIFSGRILDPTGAAVQDQSVLLIRAGSETGASATTDTAGAFTLNTQTGSHVLLVNGSNPGALDVPQFYAAQTNSFDITGNTTTDFTLPVKRVTVHVQNSQGDAVAGANLSTTSALNCELIFGPTGACGASYYEATATDISGNAVLFLFPTAPSNPDSRYTFTAIPPISSGYAAGSLTGVEVSDDMTLTIVLAAPTVLTGRLLDGAGVGIANQQMELVADGLETGVGTTTGANGAFTFSVEPGTYRLTVSGDNEESAASASGAYALNSGPFTISASQTTDFQLPFVRVDVHVAGNGGTAVPDVRVTTTAVSNCGLTFGPTTACGASSYGLGDASATTDAAGDVALWLFPTPPPNPSQVTSYRFTATPPNGSGFATTTKSNITFAGNTTETINLAASVTVTGRIVDRQNNGVPNQFVEFVSDDSGATSTITDPTGSYSVAIQEGTYRINVSGDNQNFTAAAPQIYHLTTEPFTVSGNQVINLAIPATRLDVHVQDSNGNPIANVGLTAVGPINCSLTFGPTTACGQSQYFYNRPGPGEPAPAFGVTDASGNLTLWLFATPAGDTYDLAATPMADSGFTATNVAGQALTADATLVVVLNASHAAPVTTLDISPAPEPDGSYQDPATITLSATAAPGFNVEGTFYDLDNTGTQPYVGPFNVTGAGPHTIRYFSVDDEGVAETPKTFNFTLSEPDNIAPVTTASLSAAPNAAGWHNQNVTVTLTAVDEAGGSGVNHVTYSITGAQAGPAVQTSGNTATVTITQEGASTITFWAADNAGNNEVPQTIVVRLDTTVPVINGAASPAPNANGWNNTPVTVNFTCSDAVSGVAPGSPSSPTTLSSEGANQSVTGTCADVAGNSASATVSNINIDFTAPEAYTQFDVASKDVFVFGRDSLSGTNGLPVAPVSVVPVTPFEQQKTYDVTDSGGNVMRLVLRVARIGHLVTARVVSTKYGAANATPAPLNLETYAWTLRPNGSLNTFDQLLMAPGSLVQANYNWFQNKTTITKLLPLPITQQLRNGVALLRMATLQGNLQIEY
jgi:hypothetical protein